MKREKVQRAEGDPIVWVVLNYYYRADGCGLLSMYLNPKVPVPLVAFSPFIIFPLPLKTLTGIHT